MIWITLILLIVGLILLIATNFSEDSDSKLTLKVIGSIVLVVSFFVGLWSTMKIIAPGHVGVQTTFGTVNPKPLENGIHFVNPFSNVSDVEIRTF